MYAARFTINTAPYIIFVLPRLSDSITMKTDKASSIMDFISKPRTNGISNTIHTTETAGMVSPTLASAEPNPRLIEVCIWLFLAARIAATPSGNNTTDAMITPTNARGAPMFSTKCSMTGDKPLAIKITTAKLTTNNAKLSMVFCIVGGSASCVV